MLPDGAVWGAKPSLIERRLRQDTHPGYLKEVAMRLTEAATSGNRLATLVALRDRLAEEIENTTSGRDLAALSRQFTDVLQQIEDLPNGEESSAADEIAKRREERRKANEGN